MAGGRKPIKAEMKIYPLAEMDKDTREAVLKLPKLKKTFSIMTYSQQIEVDTKRWTPKKLTDGMSAVARYELKQLATAVHQDLTKGKNFEKDALASYKRYEKIIIEKVSNALEEIKDDKGENKKALKEGKSAFQDLGKVKWNALFGEPKKATIVALTPMLKKLVGFENDIKKAGDETTKAEKELKKAQKTLDETDKGDGGYADAKKHVKDIEARIESLKKDVASAEKEHGKAQSDATKPIVQAIAQFQRSLKEATDSGEELSKLAAEIKKNDDVAPELKDYYRQLLKVKGPFDELSDAGKMTTDLLEEIRSGLKDGKANAEAVQGWIKEVGGLSDGDKAANELASLVKKLKPQFATIEKKLK